MGHGDEFWNAALSSVILRISLKEHIPVLIIKKSMKYPTKGGGGADLKLCVDPRHAALLGDRCFVGKLCRRLAGDWSDFYP